MLRYLAVPFALILLLWVQPSYQQSGFGLPANTQANEGDPVVLQVTVPDPSLGSGVWTVNGATFTNTSGRMIIYDFGQVRYLVIYSALASDTGTYQYRLGNFVTSTFLSVAGSANPCQTNNGGCGANAQCSYNANDAVPIRCTCFSGFQLQNGVCVQIVNPCLTNNGDCGSNAQCSFNPNNAVPITCTCFPGFQRQNNVCVQIVVNPCLTNNGGCGSNAQCSFNQNNAVPITCTCFPGYQRQNNVCVPIVIAADLCASSTQRNGIGYRRHPTDCDKYIQCYTSPSGLTKGIFKSCPFAHFWDQATLNCLESWKVADCPTARCTGKCAPHYKMDGSCRSYWECNKGVAEAKCCMSGMMYQEGYGCRPNFFCRDSCPIACVDRDPCAKRPSFNGDIASYNISVGNLGWVQSRCISGSYFELSECGCKSLDQTCRPFLNLRFSNTNEFNLLRSQYLNTFSDIPISNGLAYFYSNSSFYSNIQRIDDSPYKPVLIVFTYRERNTAFGRRSLFSTSNCHEKDALVISVDNANITFELRTYYDNVVTLTIPTTGFSRYQSMTVSFRYDGYEMSASIVQGTIKYYAKVYATDSNVLECGMRFGRDRLNIYPSFLGELESLLIYFCDPGNIM